MVTNRNKCLVIALVFLSIVLNVASSLELNPYVGFDYQVNRVRFKDGYGDRLFAKHYPQANFYYGLKFENCLSAEIGHMSTISKDKVSVFYQNDFINGAAVHRFLEPVVFKSYIKLKGFHISAINEFSLQEWDHFRILFGGGVCFLRVDAERHALSIGQPPISGNIRHFKKQKVVLRLMIAPEYKFNNNLGIRGSACYLNTRRVIIRATPMQGAFTPIIKLKDSYVYSLGVFFEF